MMNSFEQYDIELIESHHTQKKDSPSGTALHLANEIMQNIDRKNSWKEVKNELNENNNPNELLIKAIREENVIGEHEIKYYSKIDEIIIRHNAYNRQGFAQGALIAAKWLQNKTGFFTMGVMLNL